MPEIIAPLLAARELDSPGAARAFLQPRLKELPDPLSLRDMDAAIARLVEAVEAGERIGVFGDYDVDGATSSALLTRYFRALGLAVRVYIPDRLSEGYGPNPDAMRKLAEEGLRLVITVDCGITAFEALEAAQDAGLGVIVTDHHQAREALPAALAVINPNRLDETFPHKQLAGVGVAFYLAMGLNRALRERGWFTQTRPEPPLKPLLDLVAVGTVADVAAITGINRALVSAGLRVTAQKENAGIAALMEAAELKVDHRGVRCSQVGFQIGPRINAGGRLGRGELGHQLLSTEDLAEARRIAAELDASNQARQSIEKEMVAQAVAQVEGSGQLERARGIVVSSPGWHPGVVGIVASRLVDRFHRPALVISIDDDGVGKGSGRTVPGVDLLAAVDRCAEYLDHYGGHKAACGVTIQAENIAAFTETFFTALAELPEAAFTPRLAVDAPLPVELAQLGLAAQLQQFAPFGMGNPEPVLVLPGVSAWNGRLIKGRHVACQLVRPDGGAGVEAIGFGVAPGPVADALLSNQGAWDVAGTLSVDHWRGQERLQFRIKDVRAAQALPWDQEPARN
ncbi:putative exonuclease RecJ [Magnetofaba australis IT-1]|uniref:Single-stranded-DNA-specific exonuclease RecJ n=1 Tax=Magnetofaba australis IT-1 TaxID=1434232 RepID=A0A1Y2K5B0_9PROT|nr:putative exonuclease RecJ [Magnetofaba australis IT-1]